MVGESLLTPLFQLCNSLLALSSERHQGPALSACSWATSIWKAPAESTHWARSSLEPGFTGPRPGGHWAMSSSCCKGTRNVGSTLRAPRHTPQLLHCVDSPLETFPRAERRKKVIEREKAWLHCHVREKAGSSSHVQRQDRTHFWAGWQESVPICCTLRMFHQRGKKKKKRHFYDWFVDQQSWNKSSSQPNSARSANTHIFTFKQPCA